MNLKDEGIYCDCTVGGGGHLFMMLQRTKNARFIGIDWDPEAISFTQKRLSNFRNRVILCEGNYADLDVIMKELNIKSVNGLLFDLGASLYQLTTPQRGFSFNHSGRLLMQMAPQVIPLYKRLRNADKRTLYNVLKNYGNVPNAERLSRLIFEHRYNLHTTMDLRQIVEENFKGRLLKKNLHRVFQAFRIWTNEEFKNIEQGLKKAITLMEPEGRLVVISYHSGEDRIVKNLFKEFEKKDLLKRLNKKVIKPNIDEVRRNPSARSARMRVGERCVSL
ncbi:MAG: 16S rRNA (cytosine(1402)-N(4))-methyltransferase RsmH [candidate division WOR-3 bacterium]|nr:16S rRNA (cytosine(1402)-N(4))-methyltransferase RsmH [candidate division WOR-3 bacterium]